MVERRTGGVLLAEQLVSEGVDTIFGVPGIQLDYAVDGIAQRPELRFVSARHEQGAGYMADGYSRTAGRPGVCMVVPGPGILNAGAAMSTAYACNSRVVFVVGGTPSHTHGRSLGMLHEIERQTELLDSLTKWTRRVTDASEIADVINEAFAQVQSGRPRPVAVEIPPDVLKDTTAEQALAARPIVKEPVPESAIRSAAELVGRSSKPAIYVGGGVRDDVTSALVLRLAEQINAPIVTSRNGHGAVDTRHPLVFPRLASEAVLGEADIVISIASRFMTQQGQPVVQRPGTTLVGINIDAADLGEPRRFDVRVCAPSADALLALCAAVPAKPPWLDLASVHSAVSQRLEAVAPQLSWLDAIRGSLDESAIFVDELTQVGYPSRLAYGVHRAGTYLTPGYQGTLGYGFPTALGAKMGAPDTTVLSITGDGGFMWNVQELSTAVKYRIPVIVVLFEDGKFGNVARIQQSTFGRNLGIDLVNPDFEVLCRAFGVEFRRAATPTELAREISDNAHADGPTLIHVPMHDVPDPWPLLAEPSIS